MTGTGQSGDGGGGESPGQPHSLELRADLWEPAIAEEQSCQAVFVSASKLSLPELGNTIRL